MMSLGSAKFTILSISSHSTLPDQMTVTGSSSLSESSESSKEETRYPSLRGLVLAEAGLSKSSSVGVGRVTAQDVDWDLPLAS